MDWIEEHQFQHANGCADHRPEYLLDQAH